MESETQLLDLPTEVLMRIFDFVPNKVPLKFTCSDVYKIVCKLEQHRFRLVIKDENLHDYKSILRSGRVFDEILLRIWDFNEYTMIRLSEVLIKHQETVKKVTIALAALAEYNLIELLSFLTELREIVVDVSLWFVSCVPQQQLLKLSKVESFTSNTESAVMILELPEHILTKVSFSSATHSAAPPAKMLQSIFRNQKNIEDLTLNPKNIDLDSLQQLRLRSLVLANNENLIEILKHQKHLKSLVVRGELNSQDCSAIFENCKQLISLDINVENVSLASFSQVCELRELNDLSLTTNGTHQIIELSRLVLPKLKSFRLLSSQNVDCAISLQTLTENLPKCFPNLKHVTMTNVFCSTVSTLLKNQSLITLNIQDVLISDPVEVSLMTNKAIKELSIGFCNRSSSDVLKLITTSLPNLQKLHLAKFIVRDVDVLLEILKAFNRLTHIAVTGESFSTVMCNPAFTTFLKVHNKKLESFEFTSNDRQCSKGAQHKSELDRMLQKMTNIFSSHFALIYVDGSKFVMQCDSRKWPTER